MKKFLLLLFVFTMHLGASAQINPDVKPAASDVRPVEIGQFHSFTADNGMDVFLIRKEGYPKFRISIHFNVPSLEEEDQPEIRKITGDVLSKGSMNLSQERIKEISEQLAGNVLTSINVMTASGMKRDIDTLLPLLAGCLQYPVLHEDTIASSIEREIKHLQNKKPKREVEWLNHFRDSLSFTKSVYEPKQPTIDGYHAVTPSGVKDYLARYMNPQNSYCIVTGDFSVEEVKGIIAENFKHWEAGSAFVPSYQRKFETNYPTDRKIFVVDKPNAVQSKISVSWPLKDGYPYADNEPVLMIMNQIYGAGYNSNLNRNIRGDKGLSYGAKNFLNLNITGGSCISQTLVSTSETAYALENIFFEMLRIRNEKASEEDLERAINGMLGDYARSVSQLNSPIIIGFGMVKSEYNLPDDYLKTYPVKIARITAEDVRNAAQQYVNPYECIVIVEGDLEELKGTLEKFGPVEYFTSEGIKVN